MALGTGFQLDLRYSSCDWQPSTVIDAPLTQLARGGGEERDDGADFLGAAEAAERQLALDELGDAGRIRLLACVPRPARETGSIRARRC